MGKIKKHPLFRCGEGSPFVFLCGKGSWVFLIRAHLRKSAAKVFDSRSFAAKFFGAFGHFKLTNSDLFSTFLKLL